MLSCYLLVQPGKTLSARKWQAAFSPDGHLDIGKTLHRIQRGVSAVHIHVQKEFFFLVVDFN